MESRRQGRGRGQRWPQHGELDAGSWVVLLLLEGREREGLVL